MKKPNGEFCDSGNSFCFNGSCILQNDQCKMYFGETSILGRTCAEKYNFFGSKYGNCGYDPKSMEYLPCSKTDVQCGLLHCQKTGNYLMKNYDFKVDLQSIGIKSDCKSMMEKREVLTPILVKDGNLLMIQYCISSILR